MSDDKTLDELVQKVVKTAEEAQRSEFDSGELKNTPTDERNKKELKDTLGTLPRGNERNLEESLLKSEDESDTLELMGLKITGDPLADDAALQQAIADLESANTEAMELGPQEEISTTVETPPPGLNEPTVEEQAEEWAKQLATNPQLMAAVAARLPFFNPHPSGSGIGAGNGPWDRRKGRKTPLPTPARRTASTTVSNPAAGKKIPPVKGNWPEKAKEKRPKNPTGLKNPGRNVPSEEEKRVHLQLFQHGGEGPTGASGVKIPRRKASEDQRIESTSPVVDDTPPEGRRRAEIAMPARLCWNCNRPGHEARECTSEHVRPHCKTESRAMNCTAAHAPRNGRKSGPGSLSTGRTSLAQT